MLPQFLFVDRFVDKISIYPHSPHHFLITEYSKICSNFLLQNPCLSVTVKLQKQTRVRFIRGPIDHCFADQTLERRKYYAGKEHEIRTVFAFQAHF